ncbi:MAG: ABC transporter ATP-binding protein [Alphaproteobacteria bacterium]|nr:ABC transporter ATP-binding protein [Alphaproteobacteria bacterium]
MDQQAFIRMRNCNATGVNTYNRAQGIKHFCLGKGHLISSSIPILKNISLDINKGDRVAFIGRNGSGKSSLLKVIARIYPVESGVLEVKGTIGASIEMGFGLEQEMTGRQNIKLVMIYADMIDSYNEELEQKIIEFSELGDAIDRPVKGYSSGMISRLTFAVNLFKNSSILLLDEIFATGDYHFVEKSVKCMTEKFLTTPISILVSHQEDLLEKLCNKAYLIDGGEIKDMDTPSKILMELKKTKSS